MAVSSSVDPERPDGARPSIRFSFAVRVAAPAACLALLWLLGLAVALRAALAGRTLGHSHAILAEFGLLTVAGLAAIAAGAALTGSFGRRLAHDVTGLAAAAQHLAGPPTAATTPGTRADAAALADTANTAEVARAAAAIATLRARAAAAAASESGLRDGLRQVFVSLAKRNQSLLQRQLRLIDTLEQKAADPAALADLFALDHLTTRMRRHAESLAILSGAAPGRSWREPVAVIDVIRAAIAEVEDYKRVSVLTAAEDAVLGPAVADMIHLLAELIENATLYSPSGTRVEIRAGRVANGFAVEIDDRGLGIEPDRLREINQQLASPPDFDLADADRLGLFVGAKLAAKHGVRISLRPSPYGGTSAIALLPNSIVAPGVFSQAGLRPEGEPRQEARPAAPRPAQLNLSGAAALALTGRRAAEPERPGSQPVTAPGPGNAVPGPRPAAPGAAPAAPGPGPAAPGSVPAAGPLPTAPDRAETSAAAPAAAGTADPATVAGGTHAGLPRRTRQASLSPHLRDTAAGTGPAAAAPAPPVARTPERARDLAASVQSAWQRSRTDHPEDLPAGRDQPETHHREEAP
jgi:signal transduction histidine kinase